MTKEEALNEVAEEMATWPRENRDAIVAAMKRDEEFFSFVLCLAEVSAEQRAN